MEKCPTDFVKKLLNKFNKEYKKRLEVLYLKSYQENPEAFPLADLDNIDTYIIKGDKTFINYSYYVFLYQGSGNVIDLGIIPEEEYAKLKDFRSDEDFLVNIINSIAKIDKKPYMQTIYLNSYFDGYNNYSYKTPEEYIEIQKENIGDKMLRQLREDGSQFIDHINKEASYYAKDAFRYAYSELDFTPIFSAVEDPDFEYALNESIACYDQSLYLAAVSTAGTAMENLIVAILENEGHKSFDDRSTTELGELAGILRGKGLIDRRDRRRIMLAASFRNLASHANKGRVTRQDAKVIYQEIYNLASKIYDI